MLRWSLYILLLVIAAGCRFFGATETLFPKIDFSDALPYFFGIRPVGSQTDKVFVLTNTGDNTARDISGSFSVSNFQFKGGTFPGTGGSCADTLETKSSCSIVVQYLATEADTNTSGILTISYGPSPTIRSQVISKDLTGNAVTKASLSISDGATYSFGRTAIHRTPEKIFTITNSGGYEASNISTTVSSPFSLPGGGTCTSTLGAGESCTLIVRYSPEDFTTHTTSIDLSYNDGVDTLLTTRGVTGYGVGVPGTIDTTFGTNGFLMPRLGSSKDTVRNTAKFGNNYYIVGTNYLSPNPIRYFLARLLSNGSLDTTFYTSGVVYTSMDLQHVSVNTSAESFVSYSSSNLARFTSDGRLDTAFGTIGSAVLTSMSTEALTWIGVKSQADGKPIYAIDCGGSDSFFIGRLNTNGTSDGSFANGDCSIGVASAASPLSLVLANWGGVEKSLVAYSDSTSDGFINRYNSDGNLDTSFKTNGTLITSFSGYLNNLVGIDVDTSGNTYLSFESLDPGGPFFMNLFQKINSSGNEVYLTGDNTYPSGILSVDSSDNTLRVKNVDYVSRINASGVFDTTFGTRGFARSPYLLTSGIGLFTEGNKSVVSISSFNRIGIARINSNGNILDTSFATGGGLNFNFSDDASANVRAFTMDSNGRFAALTEVFFGNLNLNGYSPAVLRYNSNGNLDTSFHTNGVVETTLGNYSPFSSSPHQIVLINDSSFSFAGTSIGVGLIRSDGRFDTSFHTDGIGQTVGNPFDLYATTSNSIFGSGSGGVVYRYNSLGNLDTSFHTVGVASPTIGVTKLSYSIILATDGKPLVTGLSSAAAWGMFLARFTTAGPIDTSFATNGYIITTFAPSSTESRKVLIDSNNIYSFGNAGGGFGIIRYTLNGTLDTSFYTSGKVRHSISGITSSLYNGILLTNGDSLAVGASTSALPWTAIKIKSDGNLDSDFGTNGFFRGSFGTSADLANSAILQSDGKILMGGHMKRDTYLKSPVIIRLWP